MTLFEALPTLFTAANLFMGYLAILKSVEGALWAQGGNFGQNRHFEFAAVVIGVSVFFDGLDGRIARLTNTTSEFGQELDSLADVISFRIAPAVLAFVWGYQFLSPSTPPEIRKYTMQAGYFVLFMFVCAGAMRLARFNISVNPAPSNPGRKDRKYFVGTPIPAAAGMVAAVIYFLDGVPLREWPWMAAWTALLALLSYLMVSTWRYRSFKDFSLVSPRSPRSLIVLAALLYMIWNFSKPLLLAMSVFYIGSGIVVRIAGLVRRMGSHAE